MNRAENHSIKVSISDQPSTERAPVEIVELKGRGHADSLADGISETVAELFHSLSKPDVPPYIYSDKVLITPGKAIIEFGTGKIIKPFHVYVPYISNQKIDPSAIRNVIYQYLENTLSRFRREYARVTVHYRTPSKHASQTHMSFPAEFEDTAVATGYAPITRTEQVAKNIEAELNSREFKSRYPAVGEDIKLLAWRVRDSIELTVACAFIAVFIKDLHHYLELKEQIRKEIILLGQKNGVELDVNLNPDDRPEVGSVYLSVLGSSIEHGECGLSGRGNRSNGLISPLRPMSMEAVSGKNIQNHPARLLTVIAQKISNEIYHRLLKEDEEVSVVLVGKVGGLLKDLGHVYIRVNANHAVQDTEVIRVALEWLDRFISATTQDEFYLIGT